MQDGDHVRRGLHVPAHEEHDCVKEEPGLLHHHAQTRLGIPADCSCAHVGGVPVLGERGAAQDPHRHANHHLQQDPRKPQHAMEVCQNLPRHTIL